MEETLFDGIEDMDRKRDALGGSGILSDADLDDLSAGTVRVFELMCDGMWHSADDIKMAAGENGVPASEGLRRMRELRKWFLVDRRRCGSKRLWEYRLMLKGVIE